MWVSNHTAIPSKCLGWFHPESIAFHYSLLQLGRHDAQCLMTSVMVQVSDMPEGFDPHTLRKQVAYYLAQEGLSLLKEKVMCFRWRVRFRAPGAFRCACNSFPTIYFSPTWNICWKAEPCPSMWKCS